MLLYVLASCITAYSQNVTLYYRVYKPPIEDYQGMLLPGSPTPPTNSITLIDFRGKQRGPFAKAAGYLWVQIPKPRPITPILLTADDSKEIGKFIYLNKSFVAIGSRGGDNVVLTGTIAPSSLISADLTNLFDPSEILTFSRKSYINITYAVSIDKKSALPTLSAWGIDGKAATVVGKGSISLLPKATEALQKYNIKSPNS